MNSGTFASQWGVTGGSIEKLREAGQSSVLPAERYARLPGDAFAAADLGRVGVDFSSRTGKILARTRTVGYVVVADGQGTRSAKPA